MQIINLFQVLVLGISSWMDNMTIKFYTDQPTDSYTCWEQILSMELNWSLESKSKRYCLDNLFRDLHTLSTYPDMGKKYFLGVSWGVR